MVLGLFNEGTVVTPGNETALRRDTSDIFLLHKFRPGGASQVVAFPSSEDTLFPRRYLKAGKCKEVAIPGSALLVFFVDTTFFLEGNT